MAKVTFRLSDNDRILLGELQARLGAAARRDGIPMRYNLSLTMREAIAIALATMRSADPELVRAGLVEEEIHLD